MTFYYVEPKNIVTNTICDLPRENDPTAKNRGCRFLKKIDYKTV